MIMYKYLCRVLRVSILMKNLLELRGAFLVDKKIGSSLFDVG
ncbi:MAG: hypothetical protein K0R57_4058 [Paenibacillaceae bacterium]|jgi:hypothetical protein|nr:hypothetical protein [Paenibacillaceae bacterium]